MTYKHYNGSFAVKNDKCSPRPHTVIIRKASDSETYVKFNASLARPAPTTLGSPKWAEMSAAPATAPCENFNKLSISLLSALGNIAVINNKQPQRKWSCSTNNRSGHSHSGKYRDAIAVEKPKPSWPPKSWKNSEISLSPMKQNEAKKRSCRARRNSLGVKMAESAATHDNQKSPSAPLIAFSERATGQQWFAGSSFLEAPDPKRLPKPPVHWRSNTPAIREPSKVANKQDRGERAAAERSAGIPKTSSSERQWQALVASKRLAQKRSVICAYVGGNVQLL